jgi:stage III sporulation protein AE
MINTILTNGISVLLIPMIYVYLALSTAAAATGEKMLDSLGDFVQWLTSWSLKIILYVFTGYMSITGVVSGSVDATALKAAKLTMSGFVPVVGGILSDASDAVILGAGVMKNSVGVAGLIALIAIWIAPFLKIGTMYLCLKVTAALCEAFEVPKVNGLLKRYSTAMGLLLGMTAAICILLLVSVVCFMKGVA